MTAIAAVIPIWAWHMLNKLWLRPKRLEKLLIAQGLRGDPYKLLSGDNSKQMYMLKMQQEAKSKSTGLSKDDAAPRIFSPIHETINQYGKNSFFWDGTKLHVVITDPVEIKEVLSKMNDFPKQKLNNPIAKYFMTGLASYEGEKWAKHRKIINPAFHLENMKGMLPAFVESCHDMISKWKGIMFNSSLDGTCEIDVWPSLQDLSRDAISKTAFGSSYAEGTKIFELLKRLGYLILTTQRYTNIPIWW